MLLSFSHTEGCYRLKKYPGSWAWICRARLVENVENWYKAQSVWHKVAQSSLNFVQQTKFCAEQIQQNANIICRRLQVCQILSVPCSGFRHLISRKTATEQMLVNADLQRSRIRSCTGFGNPTQNAYAEVTSPHNSKVGSKVKMSWPIQVASQ